jgi:hypothetical protein
VSGSYPPVGRVDTKAMQRKLGWRIQEDLFVMDRKADPFIIDAPAAVKHAEWFGDAWDRVGLVGEDHIRRIHYILASTGALLPGGKRSAPRPYENTTKDSDWLVKASLAARILDTVDAEAFVDRRNAEIVENAPPREADPEPDYEIEFPEDRDADDAAALKDLFGFGIAEPVVWGYDYAAADQATLVELYIEKSTLRDVLEPLCKELGVNYGEAKGYESISHHIAMLRRAEKLGKPLHVLHIADFDPAGTFMTQAIARSLQFWRKKLGITVRVTVEQVALTREQVEKYKLPRKPIDEDDDRKENFEARFGEDAVELDALQALHPGVLERLVREAVAPWHDQRLREALEAAQDDADDVVSEAWLAATESLRKDGDAYNAELAVLKAEWLQMYSDGGFAQRLQALRQRAWLAYVALDPDLPERPEGAVGRNRPAPAALYDSDRNWLVQHREFKAARAGDDPAALALVARIDEAIVNGFGDDPETTGEIT